MNLKINQSVFENFPCLESERLLFRQLTEKDAHDIFWIRSNDQIMEFMDINKLASVSEAEKLIVSVNTSFENKQGINWGIVVKETNKLIGYFGFWRMITEHCRAEIGYALKPQFWGKGFMSETLNRMVSFAFEDLLLHSIEANVNPLNQKSILLLEKRGFIKEAFFRQNYLFDGRYLDSFIFSLLEPESRS